MNVRDEWSRVLFCFVLFSSSSSLFFVLILVSTDWLAG